MVLKRMRDMFVASINEGLDKLENPKVMLNQYVRDMESDIAKAKHTIIKQQTLAHNFKQKYTDAENLVAKRKTQAQLSFQAGEEELSRKALTEMKYFEQKAEEHKEAFEHATKQIKELKDQLQTLEVKLQDIKDKKHALIARANAVQAKEHMNASFNKIDNENAYHEFKRMENRIEEMEVRVNSYAGFNETNKAYSHLEYADEVEVELKKMRESQKGEKLAKSN